MQGATPGDLLHTYRNPEPGPEAFDYFGYSIATLGGSMFVGCYNDDPNGIANAGTVYQIDVSTGNLIRKISNPFPQQGVSSANH